MSEYDLLYLSPHLDDAVLSCGGQIYMHTEAGRSVLVVTFMAGEPRTDTRSTLAEYLHHNWGVTAETAVARRRAEDKAACRRLGADTLHLSVPDCIYRVHPESGQPLYTSDEALFGEVDESEAYLIEELVGKMSRLPAAGRILGPLGVGHHVDHQLTKKAAERHFGREHLVYYEDYPYVQRDPDVLDALLPAETQWKPELIPLTEAALQARLEASLAYDSQISVLFNDPQTLADTLKTYVKSVGGERVWQPLGAS
ncbi:MAG: PIG-L family deacetylase [Candidatus Promineifilaceae bacterium]|nr:PIG-L family deacetylase [Candidatus Promineifilaceae bacterium]